MFFENYQNWDELSFEGKKDCINSCVKFYEEKTVQYILSNLPLKKALQYKRENIKIEYSNDVRGDVGFLDNIVRINQSSLLLPKKDLFFKVAQNTICAVFANMFKNTTSNGGKKTKFSSIADSFLASITSEFAEGEQFENDMMEKFATVFAQENMME